MNANKLFQYAMLALVILLFEFLLISTLKQKTMLKDVTRLWEIAGSVNTFLCGGVILAEMNRK